MSSLVRSEICDLLTGVFFIAGSDLFRVDVLALVVPRFTGTGRLLVAMSSRARSRAASIILAARALADSTSLRARVLMAARRCLSFSATRRLLACRFWSRSASSLVIVRVPFVLRVGFGLLADRDRQTGIAPN